MSGNLVVCSVALLTPALLVCSFALLTPTLLPQQDIFQKDKLLSRIELLETQLTFYMRRADGTEDDVSKVGEREAIMDQRDKVRKGVKTRILLTLYGFTERAQRADSEGAVLDGED